ncbi:MAG: TMEM165/GDT1 family protein [Reyranella sp.]|nr:TMEM165/GDT1 family protein [Reyranella sp.]
MEAFFISTALVAVAEIGDKTQLLALVLAARYRKPVPIILGILIATLANHALAAWIGAAVAGWIGGEAMRWILAATFLAMAAWCLVPDKVDDSPQTARTAGAFLATLVAFFIVEIGDKTQIATVALAARYNSLVLVTAGTTLGMMLANAPVVLFGDAIARRLPLRIVRAIAAILFAALGIAALLMPSGL